MPSVPDRLYLVYNRSSDHHVVVRRFDGGAFNGPDRELPEGQRSATETFSAWQGRPTANVFHGRLHVVATPSLGAAEAWYARCTIDDCTAPSDWSGWVQLDHGVSGEPLLESAGSSSAREYLWHVAFGNKLYWRSQRSE